MIYKIVGLMSGSSLDGLDIAFVQFDETGGNWRNEISAAECIPYSHEWVKKLSASTTLNAYDYLLLHSAYGKYIGEQVNQFIERHNLQQQVQLIVSHGHTTFHAPHLGMTGQLGDGATIAAVTGINVVSDLRAMDVALGGQGAPIVPIGEQLLFADYPACINLGGIANLSLKTNNGYIAFDICPANKVLDMLAQTEGKPYDAGGELAASGAVNTSLLQQLNELDYYHAPIPKSLANDFGIDVVFPLIQAYEISTADKLRTFVAHIAMQVGSSVQQLTQTHGPVRGQLLVTGGGAFNNFLVEQIGLAVKAFAITPHVPNETIVNYKEALVMALIGALRWREENNVLHTVTGASRSSINGALWIASQKQHV